MYHAKTGYEMSDFVIATDELKGSCLDSLEVRCSYPGMNMTDAELKETRGDDNDNDGVSMRIFVFVNDRGPIRFEQELLGLHISFDHSRLPDQDVPVHLRNLVVDAVTSFLDEHYLEEYSEEFYRIAEKECAYRILAKAKIVQENL